MAPKKGKAAPATPVMTQAAIRKLIKDGIAKALVTERAAVSIAAAETARSATAAIVTEVVGGSEVRTRICEDFRNDNPTKLKGAEEGNATPRIENCTHQKFMGYNPHTFSGTGGPMELCKWFEEIEAIFRYGNCSEGNKIKFSTCTFQGRALAWWNAYVKQVGVDTAYSLPWDELRKMMVAKYYSRNGSRAMEHDILDLTMEGEDVTKYTSRFHELARLCPTMDEPEVKKLKRYIWGLSPEIRMLVASFEPNTIQEAIRMAHQAREHIVNTRAIASNNNNKRKCSNNNNRGNNATQQPPKRQGVAKAYTAGLNEKKCYNGTLPKCNKCQTHHNPGDCPRPCGNCGRVGHETKDCKTPHMADNQRPPMTCFGCGGVGHFKRGCPKEKKINQG